MVLMEAKGSSTKRPNATPGALKPTKVAQDASEAQRGLSHTHMFTFLSGCFHSSRPRTVAATDTAWLVKILI